KRRQRKTELLGVPTDLVQGDEAVVSIEGSVLEAFSVDRRGQLLKFSGEGEHLLGNQTPARRGAAEQRRLHEIEDGDVRSAAVSLGGGDRPLNVTTVGRPRPIGDVGPVYRETGHYLRHGLTQGIERVVACMPVGACDARQTIGYNIQLAGERGTHDQSLAPVHDILITWNVPHERVIDT